MKYKRLFVNLYHLRFTLLNMIEVFNQEGEKVCIVYTTKNEDLSHLPSDVYFIKKYDANGCFMQSQTFVLD